MAKSLESPASPAMAAPSAVATVAAAPEPLDPARARLMVLAAACGVSLAALSGLIGRNASYLQQFVRKGSPRKLEENDRRTLARFFGVDEVELGGPDERIEGGGGAGRESVREGGMSLAAGAASAPPMPRAPSEWADIPRLPLGASAGPGTMPEGEVPVGRLRFSIRWLKAQGLDPAMLSVIEVEGDSMEPTLRDGDEILVDRTLRPMRAGIHVIRVDGVLLVKRLEMGGAGAVRVISDNPAYPREERSLEDVHLVGRVVWKGGRI